MAMDSIGQSVRPGKLVAFNLSGSIAYGRVIDIKNERGGNFGLHKFEIEVYEKSNRAYKKRNKDGKLVSVVKYSESVLVISGIPSRRDTGWE
jgi:hypothetical protein